MVGPAVVNSKNNNHELDLAAKQTEGANYMIHSSNDYVNINGGTRSYISHLVLKDGTNTVN